MNKVERFGAIGSTEPPAMDAGRILADPQFQTLVRRRSAFAWTLSAIMVVIYLGFTLLAAFAKPLMATTVFGSATSLGIVLGLLVIILAFVLTGLYVSRANREFDRLTAAIRDRAR
jgi:uncharacterized membrane protein (DUF485 family)